MLFGNSKPATPIYDDIFGYLEEHGFAAINYHFQWYAETPIDNSRYSWLYT